MSVSKEKNINAISLIAGFFGNILEWYDFVLYGYFACIISQLFFPSEDKLASLMATFGVFAAGYIMRPLGSLIFGVLGDKVGRKKAMILSIFMMAVPTTLIGLLPTHAQVGALAPLLLILIRALQGISVGGEFPCATSYLVEDSADTKRTYAGSWSTFGTIVGILLASGAGSLATSIFNQADLTTWGWRIPFLFGAVLGTTGIFLRREMNEPKSFQELKDAGGLSEHPVREALKGHWKGILIVIFSNWSFCTTFYMIFVYLTTYMSSEIKIPLSESLDINSLCLLIMLGLIPLFGILADKHGRKPYLYASCIGFIILPIPLFWLLSPVHLIYNTIAYLLFTVIVSIQQAIVPVFNVDIFPTKVRMSAMSIGYNVSMALFGGTTPLIATYLISYTNMKIAPAYYLIFCTIVSFLIYLNLKGSAKQALQ